MCRRLCKILASLVIAVSLTFPFDALSKGWEPVRTDVSALNSVARDNDLEIRVSPGHVVVVSSQNVQIKIFTILGQLVSNETVPAGVSRLPLSHGVYIVKAGDITCKIAV